MDTFEKLPCNLGRYRLLARIASGGMGSVYLARAAGELGFSRTVAVKLLHSHLAEDESTVRRFLDEARVAARVVHPHVVTVLDVVQADGRVFLVLEYVHGDSLSSLIKQASKVDALPPLGVISAIVGDVLEGLHAAHEAVDDRGLSLGVVHRDISPQNILVAVTGTSYVTDFGIAKVVDRARVTGTGAMMGKVGYMAPEQMIGERVTRATDIYAAGIVLWEALTGARLFEGLDQQLEVTTGKRTPPKPSVARPDRNIPPPVDDLVMSMLSFNPDLRPKTAQEAARTLAKVLARAERADVADFVHEFATSKLDRLDLALRAPDQTPAPSPSARSESVTVMEKSIPETTATVFRWRRRAQASFGVAAGAIVVAIGVALAAVRTSRSTQAAVEQPPTTESPAPAAAPATSTSTSTSATPTPSPPTPTASPTAAIVAAAPAAKRAPTKRAPVRPAKTVSSAPASPPPSGDGFIPVRE